ncbi:SDR family NAD(P)-dependent oxidoreductase [Rariglobus hedericola]|uniref:SDR family oxidoreductase n=1 Tax=Rariglobus hedericola TaxID=2597822 RepID=A0A556QNT9_9BACT|nr:SDR family oxidoreductase [Rariglobus hedericola]TSJ78303.1 SDR family oxidoreductase [Rariglobus hedericola]
MTTDSAPQSQPVVLIAGVSGGIGSDVARRLTAAGWRVAGYARGADKLAALQALLPDLHVIEADATQSEAVAAAVQSTVARFGRLDAYVHAVGSILIKPAHLTQIEEWHRVIDLNLNSAFYGVKSALGPMQAQGGGSIVLISSVAAQAGLPGHDAIAAAKGGINGLVLAAAASYAGKGIRVNAVAPGLVDTPLAAGLLGSEQARQFSDKMHPLGKVGRPANVGSLIAWLVSPDADWVTGQIWSVDGGMAHVRTKPKG